MLDVAISFDTTGSMYPCLTEVRSKLVSLVNELKTIDDIRISIIAHGDYCDKDNPYTIKYMDFTDNWDELTKFIKNVERTGGGDAPECYELVLNTVRKKLSWRHTCNAILILIGDDNPHPVTYHQNTDLIDWYDEVRRFATVNIKIYAVHALNNYRKHSTHFYQTCAKETSGYYLSLSEFNNITHLIMGSIYQQVSVTKLDEYIERINVPKSFELKTIFATLKNEDVSDLVFENTFKYHEFSKEGLNPISPGRFQTFTVLDDIPIKQFVEDRGIEFKIGRGFYQFTKSETVQQYKEIILRDKKSGIFFNGEDARKLLKLEPQCDRKSKHQKERIRPSHFEDYDVFIQSTSVNRKLIAGSEFLYEISDISTIPDMIEPISPPSERKALIPVKSKRTTKKKESCTVLNASSDFVPIVTIPRDKHKNVIIEITDTNVIIKFV